MKARNETDVGPSGGRERRMIGAGLLLLTVSVGGAATAYFVLWRRRAARVVEGAREALVAVASREAQTDASMGKGTSMGDGADGARDATGPTEVVDDLKIIEGIGPRIEQVLIAAGVDSFERLAELRPGRLQTIMREAGKRAAKPDTWPDQARLAAAGQWQALKDLQDQLKRGVTVE